jgi:hypothetical protein
MNAKLTLFDRISIPTILPEKTTFAEAIVLDDLRNKIIITQDEIVEYNITNTEDGSGVKWDNEPGDGKDFELTDLEASAIKKALHDLDKKAMVPTDPKFIALYKKFIN